MAIKIIKIEGSDKDIKEEIHIIKDLIITNPSVYISKYYNSYHDKDNYYIVMEHIEGDKLDVFSEKYGSKLPTGMKHIHDMNYSHRDMSATNIMITLDFWYILY